jgi:glyoxylase-like metal-dependent hydrolase (beta-lactamase superfamily II)
VFAQTIMVGAAENAAQYVCTEQLSRRVMLAYWLGTDRRCNLTAIRSQKGLVIVDTEASPRVMAPIKQKIEQSFGRNDWVYVINTHAHDNHASGNSLFPGAVIVGHENLAQDMQWLIRRQTESEWKRRELDHAAEIVRNLRALLPRVAENGANTLMIGGEIKFWELFTQDLEEGYEVVKPTRTFADRLTLDLGDLTLELIFFGKGHSLSDTLVYIPQERLLISGAIVYQRGQLPEIGEASGLQDVNRFLSVLDRLLARDVKIDRVVPSHSPPLVRSDLLPVRDYYQRMLAGMRSARQEGLTFEQTTQRLAQAKSFPSFRVPQPGQWCYGMHERNLRNLWRILEEEQRKPQAGEKKG